MNGSTLKRVLAASSSAALLCGGVLAAQATAHGSTHHAFHPHWHQGYYGQHAVVTGEVQQVNGTSSFTLEDARVLTPGPGGAAPTAGSSTPVTITEGPSTQVKTVGQTAIEQGDTAYVIYDGANPTESLTEIVAGTPNKVIAFMAPTPEVQVEGTVTKAPTSDDPDQFGATVSVAPGFSHFHGSQPPKGMFGSGKSARGKTRGTAGSSSSAEITVSSTTKFAIDGNQIATVADLAVGDHFVATYDGTQNESISEITSAPALALNAWAPPELYGFVGSVVKTDTSSTPETITVDVSNSTPTGFFSGDTTFTVGPQTRIFGIHAGQGGRHGRKAHGRNYPGGGRRSENLSDVSVGDLVAGGEFGFSGETAATVESTPLAVLVDFPATCTNPYCTYVPGGPYYSVHTLNTRSFRSGALKTAEGLADHYKGKSHKK